MSSSPYWIEERTHGLGLEITAWLGNPTRSRCSLASTSTAPAPRALQGTNPGSTRVLPLDGAYLDLPMISEPASAQASGRPGGQRLVPAIAASDLFKLSSLSG